MFVRNLLLIIDFYRSWSIFWSDRKFEAIFIISSIENLCTNPVFFGISIFSRIFHIDLSIIDWFSDQIEAKALYSNDSALLIMSKSYFAAFSDVYWLRRSKIARSDFGYQNSDLTLNLKRVGDRTSQMCSASSKLSESEFSCFYGVY